MSQSQLDKLKHSLAEKLCIGELSGHESEIVSLLDESHSMLSDYEELRLYITHANRSFDILDDMHLTINGVNYVLMISHYCYISPFMSDVAIDLFVKDIAVEMKRIDRVEEHVYYEDEV